MNKKTAIHSELQSFSSYAKGYSETWVGKKQLLWWHNLMYNLDRQIQ